MSTIPLSSPWGVGAAAQDVLVDPILEILDGSRAVAVTATVGDRVMCVRHLRWGRGGVAPRTWIQLVLGWGSAAAGVALSVAGMFGFGALSLLGGVGLGVLAATRYRRERRSPHFTVGTATEADLHLDHEALLYPQFPLVEWSRTGHSLLFTDGMEGEVSTSAGRLSLKELACSERVSPSADYTGAHVFPISPDAHAEVELGEISLRIDSVSPSRRIRGAWRAPVDRRLLAYIGGVLALHAVVVAAVLSSADPVLPAAVSFRRQLNLIRATYVPSGDPRGGESDRGHQPPVNAVASDSIHSARRRREPSRPTAPRTDLYGLRGPRDNPDPHLARRIAVDATKNQGVLGLLRQAQGNSPGNGMIVLENLVGDVRDSAAAAGVGALRPGSRLVTARVVAGRPLIRGALDRQIIARIIRRHLPEIGACYQRGLPGASLSSRVDLELVIASDGRVISSRIVRSTIRDSRVEKCMISAAKRWLFPKPRGAQVKVRYPFVFQVE